MAPPPRWHRSALSRMREIVVATNTAELIPRITVHRVAPRAEAAVAHLQAAAMKIGRSIIENAVN